MARRYGMLAATMAVLACGQGFRVAQYPDPMALMAASKEAYRRGNCGDAAVGFQTLAFEVAPRDPLQAEIRYYLGECKLRDGAYLEAAREFRRMADEFPQHALAPDALLRAGDAYTELWRKPPLDPTYGESAEQLWRELQNRYPESTAAGRAVLRMQELREMFAKKAFENGAYYMRLGAYDAAILYFQDLIANSPNTSHAPNAVLQIIAAYDRIGYQEEKRDMCAYLRQYYPQAAPRAELCAPAETP